MKSFVILLAIANFFTNDDDKSLKLINSVLNNNKLLNIFCKKFNIALDNNQNIELIIANDNSNDNLDKIIDFIDSHYVNQLDNPEEDNRKVVAKFIKEIIAISLVQKTNKIYQSKDDVRILNSADKKNDDGGFISEFYEKISNSLNKRFLLTKSNIQEKTWEKTKTSNNYITDIISKIDFDIDNNDVSFNIFYTKMQENDLKYEVYFLEEIFSIRRESNNSSFIDFLRNLNPNLIDTELGFFGKKVFNSQNILSSIEIPIIENRDSNSTEDSSIFEHDLSTTISTKENRHDIINYTEIIYNKFVYREKDYSKEIIDFFIHKDTEKGIDFINKFIQIIEINIEDLIPIYLNKDEKLHDNELKKFINCLNDFYENELYYYNNYIKKLKIENTLINELQTKVKSLQLKTITNSTNIKKELLQPMEKIKIRNIYKKLSSIKDIQNFVSKNKTSIKNMYAGTQNSLFSDLEILYLNIVSKALEININNFFINEILKIPKFDLLMSYYPPKFLLPREYIKLKSFMNEKMKNFILDVLKNTDNYGKNINLDIKKVEKYKETHILSYITTNKTVFYLFISIIFNIIEIIAQDNLIYTIKFKVFDEFSDFKEFINNNNNNLNFIIKKFDFNINTFEITNIIEI